MVTAIIQVKVIPEAKSGYDSIAKIISQFKEVESIYLMSGDYDLSIMVSCEDLKKIGGFVAKKLSTVKGVGAISTAFVMERYKDHGEVFDIQEDERGLFTA
jgi:DNA-binding Lrp family transcriptional regulator